MHHINHIHEYNLTANGAIAANLELNSQPTRCAIIPPCEYPIYLYHTLCIYLHVQTNGAYNTQNMYKILPNAYSLVVSIQYVCSITPAK